MRAKSSEQAYEINILVDFPVNRIWTAGQDQNWDRVELGASAILWNSGYTQSSCRIGP